MIAREFGQAVVLDTGGFEAGGRDGVGEDVVDALAGVLGGEGAFSGGAVGVEGVKGVGVGGGEEFGDGGAGDVAAVAPPFFAGGFLAALGVDELDGGVGVE